MMRWIKSRLRAAAAPMIAVEAQPEAPRVMRISPQALAELALSGRDPVNPWAVPSPAPGVVPEGETLMAMDAPTNGFDAIADWAKQSMLSEGLGFLGYPYLAELSQRPEYRRISEIIAEAMTRRWIKLNGDEDKCAELEDAMRRFRVREHFRKLAQLDGFFGRAHLFIDVGGNDRPGELETPLAIKPEKIGKDTLKGFRVVEPMWCYPATYESTNPLHVDFYRPRDWYVMGRVIHRTRLLLFVGREMPDMLKPAYQFGGLSLSQMAKPYVDNWLRTRQSVSDLVNAFSIMVLKTNMQTVLSGATGAVRGLLDRIAMFTRTRSNRGVMAIDKDTEELANVSAPLGTLDALQAQSQEQLASVSGIPLVELLGVTPAGLNASSEGELKAYYGRIHDDQEHLFRENLQTVLNVLMINLWGAIDESITFEFVQLWEMDDEARARIQQTRANAAVGYINAGVVSPDEARDVLNDDEESPYFGSLSGEAPEPPENDNDGGDEDAFPHGMATDAPWHEEDHPRDADGRFSEAGATRPMFDPNNSESGYRNLNSAVDVMRFVKDIHSKNNHIETSIDTSSGGSIYLMVRKVPLTKKGTPKRGGQNFMKIRFADHGQYYGADISVDPVSGNTEDVAKKVVEWWESGSNEPGPEFYLSSIDPSTGDQYREKVRAKREFNGQLGREWLGSRELVAENAREKRTP